MAGIRVDEQKDCFVIGVGLNLETPHDQPCGIGLWFDQPKRISQSNTKLLTALLLNDLIPALKQLTPAIMQEALASLDSEKDYLKNQTITIAKHPEITKGRCLGISKAGGLKVLTEDNQEAHFLQGHILSYDA